MAEPIVTCPNCKTEIRLTESLAAPLVATRAHYEQQLAQKDVDISAREAVLRERSAKIAEEKRQVDEQVATKLADGRQAIVAEEARRARLLFATDLNDKATEIVSLREVLQQQEVKLTEAQRTQVELLRKQRELDDAKREVDLTIEKRIQEGLEAVRERAKKDAEQTLQLKVREKEEQISAMQRQIDELKRKAEQGSQQLQGEVQELQLEEVLRTRFPRDIIEPVAKGELGGDVLHRVFGPANQPCGSILWETKRTKHWSDGWLAKVRNDQREAKADVALIVSHTLPKEMDGSFDLIDGVWVTEPRCAIAVSIALRESLIALAAARQASVGQLTKMEMVYACLTSPRFRHRVEAVVERATDMQIDLDRERKAMTRLWAKREEQIRGVVASMAGMYGDLQGIAGKSLQEIEGLQIEGLQLELLDSTKEIQNNGGCTPRTAQQQELQQCFGWRQEHRKMQSSCWCEERAYMRTALSGPMPSES